MSKTVNLSKVRREKILARKNCIKKRANISPSRNQEIQAHLAYLESVTKKISQIQKIIREIHDLSDD